MSLHFKYLVLTYFKLIIAAGLVVSASTMNTVNAFEFDVEDPHLCKSTIAEYGQLADSDITTDQERLIQAVVSHCQDDFAGSIAIVDDLLKSPQSLTAAELTYTHILQSISLSNVQDKKSCDMAKLSVAFANSGASRALGIRAELGFYSFCEVTDENLAHALQRLYELNKETVSLDIPHLELAIHNQISFVYYNLDQNQLAADELEAALRISQEIAADDYIVTLYNLIDAYLDAGQLALAQQRLTLFASKLTESSSAFEKWLFYYAQSHYALLNKDYAQVLSYFEKFDIIEAPDSVALVEKLASVQGLFVFCSKAV